MKPTSELVLHLKDIRVLDIRNIKIKVKDKTQREIRKMRMAYSNSSQVLGFLLNEELVPHQIYQVNITYTASLGTKVAGYYKSSYWDDSSNQLKWLSITYFEPNYTRAAFPSFDEPYYKSTFKLSLAYGKSFTALSNMPATEVKR